MGLAVVETPQQKEQREHKLDYSRPDLYPKQEAAIFDTRRYSVIEASTKSGKTSGCVVWLAELAFAGSVGQNFWWVAPVKDQAKIAFKRMRDMIPRQLQSVSLSDLTITLPAGQVIWFKSADHADSLYGDDVYGAVMDECSRMAEDAWIALRTTITATRAPVRFIGNVKGRKNWFYRWARRAQSGDVNMGYHKLIAHDAIEANVLDAQEVEDARHELPEAAFKELYLAEASEEGANPFGMEHIAACIVEKLSDAEPFVWGWDLGKKLDWTVGTALDRKGNMCRFTRFQKPWPETIDTITKLIGKRPTLVDSTGVGDPVTDLLQKAKCKVQGYHFTAPSKQKLMEGLAVAIQSKKISFVAGPNDVLKSELENFEFEHTATGIKYAAPAGFHDDCVCSLALATYHFFHGEFSRYDSDMTWVG